MMKRSQAWFSREMRKQLKAEPNNVFRYDLSLDEILPAQRAFSAIKNAAEKCTQAGKVNQPPRQHRQQIIRHPIDGKLFRMSFSGPEGPQPIKRIRRELGEEAASKQLRRLEMNYKAELYFIEQEMDAGGDCFFEVWRGEDWIQQIPIHPQEAADIFSEVDPLSQRDLFAAACARLGERCQARANHNRSIAAAGGKQRGIKRTGRTDENIVTAFTEYKKKPGNKGHSYTTAEVNVGVKLGYSNTRKLGDKIHRMTGISPAKWYSTL